MTGQEICNLMDALKERGLSDTDIVEIIYQIEGRTPAQKKEKEDK